MCSAAAAAEGTFVSQHLELSPTEFPASRDCRLQTLLARHCPNPLYGTFRVTYTPDPGVVWSPGASIRTSYSYKYKGTYHTDPLYTEVFAWPSLQTSYPTAPNYVTVRILDNLTRATTSTMFDDETGTLQIALIGRGVGVALSPGARIEITYGDRSSGSPGYLIPPIAYDIDLVVEADRTGSGQFELVDSIMPTLRVIASEVDTFGVTAPSTPRDETFRIVVKALQGHDDPRTNMYIVPHYGGTISFASTAAGDIVPPNYTFTPKDGGVHGFDVTCRSEGLRRITVQEVGSPICGCSNPVSVSLPVRVTASAPHVPRRPKSSDSVAQRTRIYWGTLHQHTSIGGHATQTSEYAYHYARDVSLLDFFALSEHCEPPGFDWAYSAQLADEHYVPGRFVTFAAYEWASKEYGHRHIVYSNPAGENCYCARRLGKPATVLVNTLDELLQTLRGHDALLVLHHAAWRYTTATRAPTDNVVLGEIDNANQVLYEIYSHHGSSERYDNAPYVIHGDQSNQWGADKRIYFQDAIALGYHFGVTADGDDHMGMPGGHVSDAIDMDHDFHYGRLGTTAVYADTLTREAIMEALKERRTYGTTGARIILGYSVNGMPLGSIFRSADRPAIHVTVEGTDTIRSVAIIRNGYDTVHEYFPRTLGAIVDWTDLDVEPGREYSYYVRVIQADDHYAWSSPVWITVDAPLPPPVRLTAFSLGTVAPNPFNASVLVHFTLPKAERADVDVVSVDGSIVRRLEIRGMYGAGDNNVLWDGINSSGIPCASGVYYVRIRTAFGTKVARAVLLK